MAHRIVAGLPHSLDFLPREFRLGRDFGHRWSRPIAFRRGISRLLFLNDHLLFYNGPEEPLVEILGRPSNTSPVVDSAIAGYGPGYDSDAVLTSPAGEIFRWRPGSGPVRVWATATPGVDVAATGLPHDRLLLQHERGGEWRTELADTKGGQVRWTRAGAAAAVLPVEDLLIFRPFLAPRSTLCLNSESGAPLWQHEAAEDLGDLIGVVDGHAWISTRDGRIFSLSLADGREAGELVLRNNRNPQGVLDRRGRLHLLNGLNYQIVDLTGGLARLESHTEFDSRQDAPTTALGRLALPLSDGRVLFADESGKVFVVRPEEPARPECVWQDSRVFNLGIVQESLVLLDWEGRLTILGPSR